MFGKFGNLANFIKKIYEHLTNAISGASLTFNLISDLYPMRSGQRLHGHTAAFPVRPPAHLRGHLVQPHPLPGRRVRRVFFNVRAAALERC